MLNNLAQFVPSTVCLSCDGCCRFKESDSNWRPRISAAEIDYQQGLAELIFSKESVDSGERIKTIGCHDGTHRCKFFSLQGNSCTIYLYRPFECRLYPFILRRRHNKIILAVHLNCPHVQATRNVPHFDEYVKYLKSFFQQPDVLEFLDKNERLIDGYEGYDSELEDLFTLNLTEGQLGEESFKLMSLQEKITAFLSKSGNPLSSASFPNIYIWQDFFDFQCEEIDGNLCVFATDAVGSFLYLPPLGETISERAVETCFSLMQEKNKNRKISRIENIPAQWLNRFDKGKYVSYGKSPDYVYRRDDIAALKGNDYKSQRGAYNYFVEHYRGEFVPYESTMAKDCLELYRRWAQERKKRYSDPVYQQMLDDNEKVHERILLAGQKLGLIGRVLLVRGKVVGYTFGFSLDEKSFCILCEVTDLGFKGASVFLFREFCRDKALKDFMFINVMDDSDMLNIRQVKNSYRPAQLIPNHIITLK